MFKRTCHSARYTAYGSWLLGILLLLVTACNGSPAPSSTAVRTPTPTATSLPPGTILYQADWAHNLAAWKATPGWQIVGNMLQTPVVSRDLVITLPYTAQLKDYAIAFRLRIANVPKNFGSFLLTDDNTDAQDGFQAGVINIPGPGVHAFSVHPQVEVFMYPVNADIPGGQDTHDVETGSVWHDYRFVIHGPRLEFYFDGQLSGRVASQRSGGVPISKGPIRLTVTQAAMQISDFKVMTV